MSSDAGEPAGAGRSQSAGVVPERPQKFVLVVTGGEFDATLPHRLVDYAAGLEGRSRIHVAVPVEPGDGAEESSDPAPSAIVEWFAPVPPEPEAWARALGLAGHEVQRYPVWEALRWQRPGVDRSQGTGVSHICLVGRASGLTVQQFEEHWTSVHRPLAQKHHIGMEVYVQNVVSPDPGSPGGGTDGMAGGIDGIAELRFPSVVALRERFYDSEEGRTIIAADVGKFVGHASCGLYELAAGQ